MSNKTIETVSFCPHCQSGNDPVLKDTTWACGVRFNDTLWRTKECYDRQNARLNQRIKRLEEAGDALANTQTYDLLETVNWRKSKEAKP